jgi:hypothetical protein
MGVTGSNPCTTGVCTCPPRPRPPPLLSARQPSIVILRLAPLSLCSARCGGCRWPACDVTRVVPRRVGPLL